MLVQFGPALDPDQSVICLKSNKQVVRCVMVLVVPQDVAHTNISLTIKVLHCIVSYTVFDKLLNDLC